MIIIEEIAKIKHFYYLFMNINYFFHSFVVYDTSKIIFEQASYLSYEEKKRKYTLCNQQSQFH